MKYKCVPAYFSKTLIVLYKLTVISHLIYTGTYLSQLKSTRNVALHRLDKEHAYKKKLVKCPH